MLGLNGVYGEFSGGVSAWGSWRRETEGKPAMSDSLLSSSAVTQGDR